MGLVQRNIHRRGEKKKYEKAGEILTPSQEVLSHNRLSQLS